MENLELYEAIKTVPKDAQKPINGGRLKGYTDINPMWRIKTLTEHFGMVGFGWYYEVLDQRIEDGANGEKAAFVDINLYVKHDNEWSKPIRGTGGSAFVTKEKSGFYTNDECFKMALTDALSVSCKALGMGADVYWQSDGSKITPSGESDPQTEIQQAIENELLEKVKGCSTQKELEDFFKQNKASFVNQNVLIQACATRKQEINEAA